MTHFYILLLNQPETVTKEQFLRNLKISLLKARLRILYSNFKIGIDDTIFDMMINGLKQTLIKDLKDIP